MTEKIDKSGRSKIKQQLKEQEKIKLLNSLPISIATLQNLFDYVDLKMSENDCDDSLKFTLEFIDLNNLNENKLIEWLKDNGGYCDCEVLANVEEKINDQ